MFEKLWLFRKEYSDILMINFDLPTPEEGRESIQKEGGA